MVKLRRPSVPESIVVKPARRRRSAAVLRAPHCIWPDCHARLAHDHEGPICGCHIDRRIPHHSVHRASQINCVIDLAPLQKA